MVLARCEWLEDRGLPSWRPAVEGLVAQCADPHRDTWVLVDDVLGVVGQMLVQEQSPPWGWTEEERAEPALYLSGSITRPGLDKPGRLMAWWAVDRAARLGVPWVRRHCQVRQVADYNLTQGFDLIREEQRTNARLWMMARRAELLDLRRWFREGTPALPGRG